MLSGLTWQQNAVLDTSLPASPLKCHEQNTKLATALETINKTMSLACSGADKKKD